MDKEQKEAFFLKRIEEKERRRLKAKKETGFSIWEHIGTFGLIGWSITTPALLGASLGWWIDKKLFTGHSWTLTLLVTGLVFGCLSACYWVLKEYDKIDGDVKKRDE